MSIQGNASDTILLRLAQIPDNNVLSINYINEKTAAVANEIRIAHRLMDTVGEFDMVREDINLTNITSGSTQSRYAIQTRVLDVLADRFTIDGSRFAFNNSISASDTLRVQGNAADTGWIRVEQSPTANVMQATYNNQAAVSLSNEHRVDFRINDDVGNGTAARIDIQMTDIVSATSQARFRLRTLWNNTVQPWFEVDGRWVGIGGAAQTNVPLTVTGSPGNNLVEFTHTPTNPESEYTYRNGRAADTANKLIFEYLLGVTAPVTESSAFVQEVSLLNTVNSTREGLVDYRVADNGSLISAMHLRGGATLQSAVEFAADATTASLGFRNGYVFSGTGTARTLTISSADIAKGKTTVPWRFSVKDQGGDAAAFNLTIATEGSETIDGDSTLVLGADFAGVVLESNGANLFIVSTT